MSIVYQAIEKYMEEILSNVQEGNKNKVISLMNEMKNFYMTNQEMKVKKSTKVKLEKPLEVIGKTIEINSNPGYDKPVRHIYY